MKPHPVFFRLASRYEAAREARDMTLAMVSVGLDREGAPVDYEVVVVHDLLWPAPDMPIHDRWVCALSHEALHIAFFECGNLDPEGGFDAWFSQRGGSAGTPPVGRTGLLLEMEAC